MTASERRDTFAERVIFGPADLFAARDYAEDRVWYRFKRQRGLDFVLYPTCALAACAHCRRLQAARRLLHAYLPRIKRDEPYEPATLVCIGCFSKYRAVWRKWDLFCELRTLINNSRKPVQMSKPVRTTGDLRGVLLDMIEGVKSGKVDPNRASAVVKIAAQVNNSLLAEIEVNRFALQQKRAETPFGELALAPAAESIEPEPQAIAAPRQMVIVPSPKSLENARIIDRRPEGGTHSFGDPAPGRSALDQRKAAQNG